METVDRIVERFSPPVWVLVGAVVASLLGAGTSVLVGIWDTVALGGAGVAGVSALGAAGRRWWLDHLPLALAPVIAHRAGPLHDELTFRAWLGRGRRVTVERFEVAGASGAVFGWLPEGQLVGRFQVAVPYMEGPWRVVVTVQTSSGERRIEHLYEPDAVRSGRFHPGIERRRGHWAWAPDRWSSVETVDNG